MRAPASGEREVRAGKQRRCAAMISTIAYDPAGWHGFCAAFAGASGALLGLAFVAISFNLEPILENKHLPGRAVETLVFFAYPLAASLLILLPGLTNRRNRPAGPPRLESRRKRPAQLAPQPTDTRSPDRSARDHGRPGHAHHQRRRPLLAGWRNGHRNNIRTRQQLGPPRRNQTLTRRRRRPTRARRSRPDCARRAQRTSLAKPSIAQRNGATPRPQEHRPRQRPLTASVRSTRTTRPLRTTSETDVDDASVSASAGTSESRGTVALRAWVLVPCGSVAPANEHACFR
jgi:hypothetical protein